MISNQLKKLLTLMSRKKMETEIQYDIFKTLKQQHLEKYVLKYTLPNLIQHQDTLFEQDLYGHRCFISGVTDNNLQSCTFVNQCIKHSNPNHIILGGISDTILTNFHQQYKISTNHHPHQMFCKSKLLPKLTKLLETNPQFHFDEQNRIFWILSHTQQRIIVNDYYTAAYQIMYLQNCKMSYGKPSDLIVFQDFILSRSTQELSHILESSIKALKSKMTNSCYHQASIIIQMLRYYAMIGSPELNSKQITYTTALLNKFTKLEDRVLLMVPVCFVQRIAQAVHHVSIPPQKIYRNFFDDFDSNLNKNYQRIMASKSVDQILEKFALFTILKNESLENLMAQGVNIFDHSIYKELFLNMSQEEIGNRYMELKKKHIKKVFNLQEQWIYNIIHNHQNTNQIMSLSRQISQLDRRKSGFPYQLIPKNYKTIYQKQINLKLLQQKLKDVIQYETDNFQKNLMKQHMQGHVSKESIILYTKLLGRANLQLENRVKMPIHYYGSLRGLYKDYLKDYLLGAKHSKKQQPQKLSQFEQKLAVIANKLEDPEEIDRYISGKVPNCHVINLQEDDLGLVAEMDPETREKLEQSNIFFEDHQQ